MHRFEQSLRRKHVVADIVGEAIGPRQPHARLRRLVEHDVDAVEQRRDVARAHVGLDELEPRIGTRTGDVALLRRTSVVRGEAVDADDRLTSREQRVGEMTPDEARDPGDECAHPRSLARLNGPAGAAGPDRGSTVPRRPRCRAAGRRPHIARRRPAAGHWPRGGKGPRRRVLRHASRAVPRS